MTILFIIILYIAFVCGSYLTPQQALLPVKAIRQLVDAFRGRNKKDDDDVPPSTGPTFVGRVPVPPS